MRVGPGGMWRDPDGMSVPLPTRATPLHVRDAKTKHVIATIQLPGLPPRPEPTIEARVGPQDVWRDPREIRVALGDEPTVIELRAGAASPARLTLPAIPIPPPPRVEARLGRRGAWRDPSEIEVELGEQPTVLEIRAGEGAPPSQVRLPRLPAPPRMRMEARLDGRGTWRDVEDLTITLQSRPTLVEVRANAEAEPARLMVPGLPRLEARLGGRGSWRKAHGMTVVPQDRSSVLEIRAGDSRPPVRMTVPPLPSVPTPAIEARIGNRGPWADPGRISVTPSARSTVVHLRAGGTTSTLTIPPLRKPVLGFTINDRKVRVDGRQPIPVRLVEGALRIGVHATAGGPPASTELTLVTKVQNPPAPNPPVLTVSSAIYLPAQRGSVTHVRRKGTRLGPRIRIAGSLNVSIRDVTVRGHKVKPSINGRGFSVEIPYTGQTQWTVDVTDRANQSVSTIVQTIPVTADVSHLAGAGVKVALTSPGGARLLPKGTSSVVVPLGARIEISLVAVPVK